MVALYAMFIYVGALAWYQREWYDLEVIQNGFCRWLWEVGNVLNEIVRGESEWSSFAERGVENMADLLLYDNLLREHMISDSGRLCLTEIGYKYSWWARCKKFGLWELINLLWLSVGICTMHGMEYV